MKLQGTRWNLIGALLLLAFFAVWPLTLLAGSLSDVQQDANAYARNIMKGKDLASGQEQSRTLYAAADLMSGNERCDIALVLREQAWSLGMAPSFLAWKKLAKDAYCARKWIPAVRAAWLATRLAPQPRDKAVMLGWLGRALESRWGDWDQAALDAYAQSLKIMPLNWVRKRHDSLYQKIHRELQVEEISAPVQGQQAQICVKFSVDMPSVEDLHYEDYIRTQPSFKALYTNDYGKELCLAGAAFGVEYTVQVRKGLKSGDKVLAQSYQAQVQVPHKYPELWFKQSAFVMPARGEHSLPLFSINKASVSLELLRVHERNLLSPLVQDNFQENLSSYEIGKIRERLGEPLWSGDLSVDSDWDKLQTTALALPAEFIAEPGLYLLVAVDSTDKGEASDYAEEYEYLGRGMDAVQWLVVTDIGLSSYQGSDGLWVVARSLDSGQPLAGVEVSLLARNNKPLARLRTDSRGVVKFAAGLLHGSGANEAVQVTASGANQGLAFLSLQTPALDLSDRGVSGRAAPTAMDVFAFSERGVYRPGESLAVTALLRNARGLAISGLPLTARLLNPQGQIVVEKVLKSDHAGGFVLDLNLPAAARTGRWQVAFFADPDAPELGSTAFLVEAIRPPRMEAHLQLQGPLRPGETLQGQLQADYLFGAPAAGRPVVSRLQLEADAEPFADYKGYVFLPAQHDTRGELQELPPATTDEKGHAQLQLALPSKPEFLFPLRARVISEVRDVDGRVARDEQRIPVRHLPFYIGIQAEFSEDGLPANSQAGFRLLSLNPQGQPVARKLEWRLIRVEKDYQWFHHDGKWGYEAVAVEQPEGNGWLNTRAGDPVELELPVGEGEYRIEVFDRQSGLLSAWSFQAGDRQYSQSDTPDAVELTLDKHRYAAGEPVHLQVQAPFSGSATLVLASDRVHRLRHIELHDGKAEVSFPADGDWGAGIYALVTAYRAGGHSSRVIDRAVGVVWVELDSTPHQLQLQILAPPSTPSGHIQEIEVQVKGQHADESVFVTLAAVDDGVLGLTDYVTPDPLQHYYGKRTLATGLRDVYGQIIRAPDARPQLLRNGAGASGRRGMVKSNIQVVSLFSGLLQADAAGHVSLPLSLPQFNGRLRLMAVAWSGDKLGSAQQNLLVRDPLVLLPSLPRFLTTGDYSRVQLLLQNLEAPSGRYHVSLKTGDKLELTQTGNRDLELQRNQSASLAFALLARQPGAANLLLSVDGPAGFHLQRRLKLGIRGPALPVIQRSYQRVATGQSLSFGSEQFHGLYPQTVSLDLQLSSHAWLDVPGLLEELARYPYGCLEQLSSRAYPLLYFNTLAQRWQLPQEKHLHQRVQKAINEILNKQQPEGGFGLWSATDYDTAEWPSLYAIDFLLQAEKAGYAVPQSALDAALDWVQNRMVRREDMESDTRRLANIVYGHYLLTLAGRGQVEELRYLADNHLQDMPSNMARAQLGAALARLGQEQSARQAFAAALSNPQRNMSWQDYGSELRDLAAVIYLLEQAGAEYGDPAPLVEELVYEQQKRRWFSTQERAWMVLAATGLGDGSALQLRIDGQSRNGVGDRLRLQLSAEDLKQGKTVENGGNQPIWLIQTLRGTPNRSPFSLDKGFKIKRRLLTVDGKPVDANSLKPGDLLVVLLEGEADGDDAHPALVVDLIPAGLEGEISSLSGGLNAEGFDWLPELTPVRYRDLLDDRFVAALDIEAGANSERHFTLAYLMRVVAPGDYLWPGTEVEDMYRPFFRARSTASRVVVKE